MRQALRGNSAGMPSMGALAGHAFGLGPAPRSPLRGERPAGFARPPFFADRRVQGLCVERGRSGVRTCRADRMRAHSESLCGSRQSRGGLLGRLGRQSGPPRISPIVFVRIGALEGAYLALLFRGSRLGVVEQCVPLAHTGSVTCCLRWPAWSTALCVSVRPRLCVDLARAFASTLSNVWVWLKAFGLAYRATPKVGVSVFVFCAYFERVWPTGRRIAPGPG